jgi:hypothetical protein
MLCYFITLVSWPILLWMVQTWTTLRDGDLSLTAHQELFDAYRGPSSGSHRDRRSMISGLASRPARSLRRNGRTRPHLVAGSARPSP